MDGISAVGSVAGVAAAGVQLSKFLYDFYATVQASNQEIQDVANNVSLLAMVLEELDGVLIQDEVHFRPELHRAAQLIVRRCAGMFKDIEKHTATSRNQKGLKITEKVAWYFKRDRVKPLSASLESLKSTLNILLHVVQLAKTTKNVEEYPGVKPVGDWYVRKERRGLVCLVIDNRHTIEKLRVLEEETFAASSRLIANEPQISFAEILQAEGQRPGNSPSNRSFFGKQRSQSPERKFIVSFASRVLENDNREEQDQRTNVFATSRQMSADGLSMTSSSMQDKDCQGSPRPRRYPYAIPHSNFTSHTTRKKATSRMILDIIPHEKADEILASAQYLTGSAIVEAKAEETVDTLMRLWTFVDPKYFSDDDEFSDSAIDVSSPRSPCFRQKLNSPPRPPAIPESESIHELSSIPPSSRRRKPFTGTRRPSMQGNVKKQSVSLDDIPIMLETTKESLPNIGQDSKHMPRMSEHADRPPSVSKGINIQEPEQKAARAHDETTQCPHCYSKPPRRGEASLRPAQSPSTSAPDTLGKGHNNNANERALDIALRFSESLSNQHTAAGARKAPSENTPGGTMQVPPTTGPSGNATRCGDVVKENEVHVDNPRRDREPITLKDSIGRRLLFPIQSCRKWQDMERLLRRSFIRYDTMSNEILKGKYDLLSPKGEIILPEIWEAVIQPGWEVELRFWSDTSVDIINSPTKVDAADSITTNYDAKVPKLFSEATPGDQSSTSHRRASVRSWLGRNRKTANFLST